MRTTVSQSPVTFITGLAALALLLGGCAANNNDDAESPAASQSPTTSTSPGTGSPSPSASTPAAAGTSAPGGTAAPSGAPEPGVPSSVPLCTADKLSGAVEDTAGGGAAGSVYRTLVLTNISEATCSTMGFPGVSYLSVTGSQVGAPASRSETTPETLVVLEPGQSATAVLRETRPENYGDACGLIATSGFQVYPPEDTASLTIAHAGSGCSNADIELLDIDRLQAG